MSGARACLDDVREDAVFYRWLHRVEHVGDLEHVPERHLVLHVPQLRSDVALVRQNVRRPQIRRDHGEVRHRRALRADRGEEHDGQLAHDPGHGFERVRGERRWTGVVTDLAARRRCAGCRHQRDDLGEARGRHQARHQRGRVWEVGVGGGRGTGRARRVPGPARHHDLLQRRDHVLASGLALLHLNLAGVALGEARQRTFHVEREGRGRKLRGLARVLLQVLQHLQRLAAVSRLLQFAGRGAPVAELVGDEEVRAQRHMRICHRCGTRGTRAGTRAQLTAARHVGRGCGFGCGVGLDRRDGGFGAQVRGAGPERRAHTACTCGIAAGAATGCRVGPVSRGRRCRFILDVARRLRLLNVHPGKGMSRWHCQYFAPAYWGISRDRSRSTSREFRVARSPPHSCPSHGSH